MLASLIGLVTSAGIPTRFAKPILAIIGALLLFGLLWGAKCSYDRHLIANHEATQTAATAKADRQADQTAATSRVADQARADTEATQIKEAVNEAGNDPAARRAAYYACVRAQQAARRAGKLAASC